MVVPLPLMLGESGSICPRQEVTNLTAGRPAGGFVLTGVVVRVPKFTGVLFVRKEMCHIMIY